MKFAELIWAGRKPPKDTTACIEAAGFFWRLLKPLSQWPKAFLKRYGTDARHLFCTSRPVAGVVCLCDDVDDCPEKPKFRQRGHVLRKCSLFFEGVCLDGTAQAAGPGGISHRLLAMIAGWDDAHIKDLHAQHLRSLVERIVADPNMRALLEDRDIDKDELAALLRGRQ